MKLRHMRSRLGRRGGKMFRNGGWNGGIYQSRKYSSWNDLKPLLPIRGSQV